MPLNDKDARAVDWIMSQQSGAGVGGSFAGAGMSFDASLGDRVERVQSLLSLLDLLPAEEPPADLVGRTLARLHRSAAAESRPSASNDSESATA